MTDLSTDTSIERLPPQSIEAEQAILGSLLINTETLTRVVDVLQPDHFYRKSHQVIYAAILDLFEKSEPIDIVTLSQYLKDQGKLDNIGGRQYLTDLALSIATTANAEYYAKTVSEKSLLRNLIKAGTEIVSNCYEDGDNADLVVDKAEQLIFSIAQRRSMAQLIHIKDIVNDSFARIEQRYENRDTLSGISTGFYDLDEMTSGWQKSDLVIIAARPSMGKCLSFDSEIVLSDGSIKTIKEIHDAGNATLLTLDDSYKLNWTKPSAVIDDGIKPVFRVTTKLGRVIETTITHPFLTIDGWKKLGELATGVHIAVPRKIPVTGTNAMRECELKLLAYLIGDGCLSNGKTSFCNSNPALQQDFQTAIEAFGNIVLNQDKPSHRTASFVVSKNRIAINADRKEFMSSLKQAIKNNNITGRALAAKIGVTAGTISHWVKGVTAPDHNKVTRLTKLLDAPALSGWNSLQLTNRNQLETWLDKLGLWGKTAHTKFIPAAIFTLNQQNIALFLNRLFSTDGWASLYSTGQCQIGYASVSEKLIRQIQHLLLRFGIIAKIRQRTVKYRGQRRSSWQLEITDKISLEKFVSNIGIFGKEAAVKAVGGALDQRRTQSNCDLIPIAVWNRLQTAKGQQSWASVAQQSGLPTSNLHASRRSLSRGRLLKLAIGLNDAHLKNLSESDVYWDEIVSIVSLGDKQVYDLTIPDTHNFIANDICVHNTALVLNLAQHCAVECKQPVALFSLEMSKEQLVQRLLCAEAKIDANKLRTGFLQSGDWQNLATAMGRLGEAPIFIDDSAALGALDIRAKARRLKAEYKGLGLIIIDYIQLMQGRAKSDGNRVQEISEISRNLKQLARELNVPVLALSQLSRAVESRQNKRPMLSDLRESGAIEQDADIVMFIYRDEYYNPETEKRGEAEIIIAKQRNGPVGTVELLYQASITRFLNKAIQNTYATTEGQQ